MPSPKYYRSILYKVGKKIHPLFNKLENKPYAKLYHYIGNNTNSNNNNNENNTNNDTSGGNTTTPATENPTYYNPYDLTTVNNTNSNTDNNQGQISTPNDTSQYKVVLLPVVHSIEMEQVKRGNEIITEKREVFIFQKSDLMEKGINNITLNDLVEFPFYPEPPDDWQYNPQLYRVIGIQDILSLIKLFTKKVSV